MTNHLVKALLVIFCIAIANSEIIPNIKKELSSSPIRTKMDGLKTNSHSLSNRTPIIPKIQSPTNPTKTELKSDMKGQQSYILSGSGSNLDNAYAFDESLIFGSNSQDPFGSQQDKGQDSYINSGSGSTVGGYGAYDSNDIFGSLPDQDLFVIDPKGQINEKVAEVTVQELQLYLALRSKIIRAGIFK